MNQTWERYSISKQTQIPYFAILSRIGFCLISFGWTQILSCRRVFDGQFGYILRAFLHGLGLAYWLR